MILIYKILIMEKSDIINIDVFTFDTSMIKTKIYSYHIAEDTKRRMLDYIKTNDYRKIYLLIRQFIIDNPTMIYDQECLFCISTKDYTFNFTLNEVMK